MKYIQREFKHEEIIIAPLGDLHIGAPESTYEKCIEYVRESPDNAYFILLGDMLDNSLTDSLGNVYKQEGTPEEAYKELRDIFLTFGSKLLGVVGGNHEYRTTRRVGVDIVRLLCEEKNIHYDPNTILFDITLTSYAKHRNYLIFAGHGTGGGRTIGGKVNAAKRLTEIVNNADIYISGHTHQPACWKDACYTVDRYNKNLRMTERHNVVIPAWLEYPEYAEQKFYAPQPGGMIEITLSSKKKDIMIIAR